MDDHFGWAAATMAIGGIAMLGGFAVASAQVGPWGKTPPPWMNNLQACWLIIFACSGGLVVVSNRMTRLFPDLFALVYVALVLATVAIAFLLTRPAFRMFQWVPAISWFIFALIVAVLIKLGNPNDPVAHRLWPYLWLIPAAPFVGVYLWIAYSYFFRKETRSKIAKDTVTVTAIVGWVAIMVCVASWVK
jgi:hypothetical protein